MEVLINEKAYHRWAARMAFIPELSLTVQKVKDMDLVKELAGWQPRKEAWLSKHKPKEFPCVARSEVTDWNYQETEPVYLYREDLENYLLQMSKVKGTK
jgi:hypothetical protein